MHDRRPPGAGSADRVPGRRIYSLEPDELNKASKRWMVNDDGTLTPENKPSTGSLNTIVTQKQENVKSVLAW